VLFAHGASDRLKPYCSSANTTTEGVYAPHAQYYDRERSV
jgi:hypothetical protein